MLRIVGVCQIGIVEVIEMGVLSQKVDVMIVFYTVNTELFIFKVIC